MQLPTTRYCHPPGLDGVELLHLSDPDFGFAPHTHDGYVFWLNAEGGERVSLAGCSNVLQPDSFGVVAPGEIHANHAVTEHRTLQSFYIGNPVLEDVAVQLSLSGGGFRSRLQRDPQGRAMLARLHAVLMLTDDTFLVRETFLRVFGYMLEQHGETGGMPMLSDDSAKVRRAREIMHDCFTAALDIDELATACGCTACHLIRLFRQETGITPHAYLMQIRLLHAKSLLATPTAISEIALAAGFTDQSHLTRRFRARFGLTPARYRQQISS